MTHFSLKKMVAAEGNGFFEAKNTACSEYYPSFQVYQNKTFNPCCCGSGSEESASFS